MSDLKIGIVTKEWPPTIYGGAGVHALQLTQALRATNEVTVDVHCFGGPRDDAFGYSTPSEFVDANPAVQALVTDLEIASKLNNVDVVHSHTWYANMAGHIASLQFKIPHVVSAHSLEPLRPWKADQLGGGYAISSWAEKTAYESAAAIIAVSDGMRADVLAAYPKIDPNKVVTIRNGVDTDKFVPNRDSSVANTFGVSGRYAIFVGRITRQKGLAHLLRAWKDVPAEYGLVLAAGSPDEVGIGSEVAELIAELQKIVFFRIPKRDFIFATVMRKFHAPWRIGGENFYAVTFLTNFNLEIIEIHNWSKYGNWLFSAVFRWNNRRWWRKWLFNFWRWWWLGNIAHGRRRHEECAATIKAISIHLGKLLVLLQ